MLTISYQTSRKDCRFEWFADSLHAQTGGDYKGIRLVVVDFWAQNLKHHKWESVDHWKRRKYITDIMARNGVVDYVHTAPKPCVWQGPHRLTKNDYFAPSNARNTAACYAPGGHIAYVDDVSVLLPGWLVAVKEAVDAGYVSCGAFRKVNELTVEKGVVKSFKDHPPGWDSRWKHGKETGPVECAPNWLFGCSAVIPTMGLIQINGWPEYISDSTGVGAEDCFVGEALQRNGYKLMYDRRQVTYESEELHQQNPTMKRMEKGKIGTPDSKSHEAVRQLRDVKWFKNDFCGMDFAALRTKILNGGNFPIPKEPSKDWYDGQLLSEL